MRTTPLISKDKCSWQVCGILKKGAKSHHENHETWVHKQNEERWGRGWWKWREKKRWISEYDSKKTSVFKHETFEKAENMKHPFLKTNWKTEFNANYQRWNRFLGWWRSLNLKKQHLLFPPVWLMMILLLFFVVDTQLFRSIRPNVRDF